MEPANIVICHMIGSHLAVSQILESYQPPTWEVKEKSIEEALKSLCSYHVKLDFQWLAPKLLDVKLNWTGGVDIIYGTQIPLETPLKEGFWTAPNIDSKLLRRITYA